MSTIHEQLDELLAADLHDELTAAEREEFHAHLVECAECRQAFQEGKTMNRILNETLAEKKADPAFEQRMVSRFRDRIPKRRGLVSLFADLMRLRSAQISAVAALLLALVTTGHWLSNPDVLGNEELVRPSTGTLEDLRLKLAGLYDAPKAEAPPLPDQEKPGATRETAGVLSKADGRNKTVAPSTVAPAPPPSVDAVTSTVPKPQTEALRAAGLTKAKKNEFKDEKS